MEPSSLQFVVVGIARSVGAEGQQSIRFYAQVRVDHVVGYGVERRGAREQPKCERDLSDYEGGAKSLSGLSNGSASASLAAAISLIGAERLQGRGQAEENSDAD